MTTDITSTWMDNAACSTGSSGLNPMFFSDQMVDVVRAKRICRTCPIHEACLTGALERREPEGVWGGSLFINGRIAQVSA